MIDDLGNVTVIVGELNGLLFAAHTDTVHHVPGAYVLHPSGSTLHATDTAGNGCVLGADDTVGCWILRQMIKAGIEGTYIFHNDEESGAGGAMHIKNNRRAFLEQHSIAVEFDRRGIADVITHMGGQRVCSQVFASALCDILNGFCPDFTYKPCTGGSFTDVKKYADIIPEVTNISVGYDHEHSATESLDMDHALALLDVVLKVDWGKLPVSRNPVVNEYLHYNTSYNSSFTNSKAIYDPVEWIREAIVRHRTGSRVSIEELIRASNWAAATAVDYLLEILMEDGYDSGESEPGPLPGTVGLLPQNGEVEVTTGQFTEDPDDDEVRYAQWVTSVINERDDTRSAVRSNARSATGQIL